jgi:sugar lactone lactonase YvrE
VISLYKSSDDILWIGTFGQGLYIFDPKSKKIKHLTERDHLSNTSILHISGKDKMVWLSTLGGVTQIEWQRDPFESGLKVIELQDQFDSPPGYVYDGFVSSSGKVWFCTDGKGLFYLENGALHAFPISYVENDSVTIEVKTIYSLTEDWEHRLWISIPKGIVLCVDPNGKFIKKIISSNGALNSLVLTGTKELLLVREGAIQTINANGQFFWLDESSGLTSFTPEINATDIDADGSVWIADTDVLLHYSSYNLYRERYVKMHFEDISPGSLDQMQPVKLSPDSNFLDVRFTGIWYQDPTHVHYRYMLNGHDADWIYTQEGRAVYSRLSPGYYTFTLQGSQDDDFSQSPTLERSFIVMPPIYLRWWFILSMTILAAWIVYSFIRARIKRLQKLHLLEKEKTTHQLHAIQAQVNPHFLFNSFNTLSSIIEEDQKAAVDYVDQLSAFFRGALMHRDDELITIAEEMDIVKNYMYILVKRYGENVRMEEHITNLTGWIAPLSIQLLVENAIKHNTVSSGKKLSIRITIDHQWVEVSNPIQPKFQSNEESTGFGLSSLITRYTYLTPLKIEINKETNRFTVRIPILYPIKGT